MKKDTWSSKNFDPLGIRLLSSSWLLDIRSRSGFRKMLAWFRFLGCMTILVRFRLQIDNPLFSPVPLTVFFAFLGYSLLTIFLPSRNRGRLDVNPFHYLTIVLDSLFILYFVSLAGKTTTELYLLLLLPIVTAAHFLPRRSAVFAAATIIAIYFVVLLRFMQYENYMRDVQMPWIGRSLFLLAGAWLYRVQRGLPQVNESWITSPSDARDTLERLLRELKQYVPFDSASVQVVYRERLQIIACLGFENPGDIHQIEFPTDDPNYPNFLVMQTHQPKIVSARDYPSFREKNYYAEHVQSWMGVPLISPATGEFFGMISIDAARQGAFGQQDIARASAFAKRVSTFLIEAALGPAAMTQASSRENLLRLLGFWAKLLPQKSSQWEDEVQAAQELVQVGQKIFRTEDCSIFFLRRKYEAGNKTRQSVLHLVASTAIPLSQFGRREILVTGQPGDGLTGYAVHTNRTINYGARQVKNSPYLAGFTGHLKYFFSGRSKQVMIVPLRDAQGAPIGAIKIENRMGASSDREFFSVERNLFEIFAATAGMIIETIRQRNYIRRHEEGVHNLRGIIHHAAIVPIEDILKQSNSGQPPLGLDENISDIHHALNHVKMEIHGLLSDSEDSLHLEKEGLIHALHRYLKSLRDIPYLSPTCDCIRITALDLRDDELPYRVQEVFYNVACEGILNMVRHSKIDEQMDGFGEISIRRENGTYCMVIEDNGVGFSRLGQSTAKRPSFGLYDMERQIRLLKASSRLAEFNVFTSPGQGTRVQVCWAPQITE